MNKITKQKGKKDTNTCRNVLGSLTTVNMSILQEFIYKSNTIPMKIPSGIPPTPSWNLANWFIWKSKGSSKSR